MPRARAVCSFMYLGRGTGWTRKRSFKDGLAAGAAASAEGRESILGVRCNQHAKHQRNAHDGGADSCSSAIQRFRRGFTADRLWQLVFVVFALLGPVDRA